MKVTNRNGGAEGQALDADGSPQNGPTAHRHQKKEMSSYANFDFSEEALLKDDDTTDSTAVAEEDADKRPTNAKAKPEKDHKSDGPTVLATAAGTTAPNPQASISAPAFSLQLSVGADRATEIISRIEQALRASLHMGSEDVPLTMQIRLDDLGIPGLNSVQIDMTPKILDIGFLRETGDVGPEMLAAAQSLAQQLAVRFPTKVIRVLDASIDMDVDRHGSSASAGLGKLSELFARRGDAL
jgi:hypothetical protein